MKRARSAAGITVGVVGYGGSFNMGREHLKAMVAAGMTPVAVAEIDTERRATAAADFPGIRTFSSVDEMLRGSEVSLVVIITPHDSHAPLAMKCLRAGRHVVCEKPLAITTTQVDKMIRAARKAGVMLSTYHNRHWDGCILETLDLVRRRAIGEIVRIDCHMGGYGKPRDWWRSSRSISGGILYDWGVHLLEYSLQLVASPVTEVVGFSHSGFWAPKTRWGDDTIEDEAYAVARFASGQWLTLRMSSIQAKPNDGMLEITGAHGTVVVESAKLTVHTRRGKQGVVTTIPCRPNEYERYYGNIRDHLARGVPLVITAEWSRRPIHILDLAVRSAREGRALRVDWR